MDFGNHSSTKTCQIFGTIYSINFQSQNQTLKDRKMKNVPLFWQFADTFQPCWPCLLWTFCKLCSDWASFTKQLIRIQLLDLFGVTSTFRKRKLPDKENSFRSFKSLKIRHFKSRSPDVTNMAVFWSKRSSKNHCSQCEPYGISSIFLDILQNPLLNSSHHV